MTVFVSSAWLDPSQDNARDVSHQADAFEAALTAIREAHAGETAALRERADGAERRAAQAEQGRDAERARADALRDRIEAMQVQLGAEAEAAVQARRQAQAAQDNAEILREADAARKGRGRLARVLAAWRGE
jgi:hypothetical protein